MIKIKLKWEFLSSTSTSKLSFEISFLSQQISSEHSEIKIDKLNLLFHLVAIEKEVARTSVEDLWKIKKKSCEKLPMRRKWENGKTRSVRASLIRFKLKLSEMATHVSHHPKGKLLSYCIKFHVTEWRKLVKDINVFVWTNFPLFEQTQIWLIKIHYSQGVFSVFFSLSRPGKQYMETRRDLGPKRC